MAVVIDETLYQTLKAASRRDAARIDRTLRFLDKEEDAIGDSDGYTVWLIAEVREYLTDDDKVL